VVAVELTRRLDCEAPLQAGRPQLLINAASWFRLGTGIDQQARVDCIHVI
jgi:hypothetical protein